MDIIDNRNNDHEPARHPLFVLEDALKLFRSHLRACEGETLDRARTLNLSIYLDRVEAAYLDLRSDVIERIVTDHNFRSPSLN